MTDFLAGFYGGVALGWLLSQLFSRRRRIYLVRSPRPRPSNLLELPPLPRRRSNMPPPPGRLIRLDRNPDLQLMDQPSCVPKPTFLPPRENPGDTP